MQADDYILYMLSEHMYTTKYPLLDRPGVVPLYYLTCWTEGFLAQIAGGNILVLILQNH